MVVERPAHRGLRRYPPAYAPLPAAALSRAALSIGSAHAPADLASMLCQRYTADRATLFASGTQALTAALRAAIAHTREKSVALPAFTCFDVATAAVGADAAIAFYDVDPVTLQPDYDSLERALSAGAGTAVIAPLYGVQPDWQRVRSIAGRNDALIIEDAAQGIGSSWHGKVAGSLGVLSVLSFGRGKGWTGGGGGVVLDRGGIPVEPPGGSSVSRDIATIVKAAAQAAFSSPRLFALPAAIPWLRLGETHYHAPSDPSAITAASAALVMQTAQSAVLESRHRRERAHALMEFITGFEDILTIPVLQDTEPGYLRLPVRVPSESYRRTLLLRGAALGVAQTYPAKLNSLHVLHGRASNAAQHFRGAECLVAELITLPTHSRSQQELLRNLLVSSGRSPS
ncbi:MAG TPA: DegT/DnrJ/EryC1/StrS family aminotransferase [Longimicrobiales bacterium]